MNENREQNPRSDVDKSDDRKSNINLKVYSCLILTSDVNLKWGALSLPTLRGLNLFTSRDDIDNRSCTQLIKYGGQTGWRPEKENDGTFMEPENVPPLKKTDGCPCGFWLHSHLCITSVSLCVCTFEPLFHKWNPSITEMSVSDSGISISLCRVWKVRICIKTVHAAAPYL